MAERAADCGGCEYLRLLSCPTAMGSLKPATSVTCPDGTRFEIALDDADSGASLRERCGMVLKRPAYLLHLSLDRGRIEDTDAIEPFASVSLTFLGEITLHVLTGCCQAAIERAEVFVDDQSVGITGVDGICVVHALAGSRQIKVEVRDS